MLVDCIKNVIGVIRVSTILRIGFIAGVFTLGLVPAAADPRLLPLEGSANARDIGGYETVDGRSVRWGVLFRSGSLAELTDADVAYLGTLGLAAVTDFRSESERKGTPDRLPQQEPPIAYRTLSVTDPAIDVAELGRSVYAGELSEAELLSLTDRRAYVENPDMSRKWGTWVASLAKADNLPHLFHCTAGKDRTGFAAALLLLTLGVPQDQVMQDFLLSNEHLSTQIENGIKAIRANSSVDVSPEVLRQVIGVTPQSIDGAIASMIARFGSVDGFVERGLGIDAETRIRLQDLLLE